MGCQSSYTKDNGTQIFIDARMGVCQDIYGVVGYDAEPTELLHEEHQKDDDKGFPNIFSAEY